MLTYNNILVFLFCSVTRPPPLATEGAALLARGRAGNVSGAAPGRQQPWGRTKVQILQQSIANIRAFFWATCQHRLLVPYQLGHHSPMAPNPTRPQGHAAVPLRRRGRRGR